MSGLRAVASPVGVSNAHYTRILRAKQTLRIRLYNCMSVYPGFRLLPRFLRLFVLALSLSLSTLKSVVPKMEP